MQTEKRYQLALSLINGIGSINAKKLLAYVGSPEAVFKEKKQNLVKIPGIGEKVAKEVFKHGNTAKNGRRTQFYRKTQHYYFFLYRKRISKQIKTI
jgi:DNA processing protein